MSLIKPFVASSVFLLSIGLQVTSQVIYRDELK